MCTTCGDEREREREREREERRGKDEGEDPCHSVIGECTVPYRFEPYIPSVSIDGEDARSS